MVSTLKSCKKFFERRENFLTVGGDAPPKFRHFRKIERCRTGRKPAEKGKRPLSTHQTACLGGFELFSTQNPPKFVRSDKNIFLPQITAFGSRPVREQEAVFFVSCPLRSIVHLETAPPQDSTVPFPQPERPPLLVMLRFHLPYSLVLVNSFLPRLPLYLRKIEQRKEADDERGNQIPLRGLRR